MPRRPKIAVVGAGNVGQSAALFIAEKELGDVVLVDIVPDMPRGKALDILEGAPVGYFDVDVRGESDMGAISGADLVIVTAGSARKPGMTRDDLLEVNVKVVKSIAENIKKHAPEAFVIVVTNPLDVMAWVTKEVTGFDRRRVVGMAGVLDGSRFSAFIAEELNVSVKDVSAMVMGGHGDSMVPIVSCASVSGIPITELLPREKIDKLIERTRFAGGEIVKLLGTGSAYVSPAASAVMMAEACLRDQRRIVAASACLEGEYGISGIYLGVPVKLSGLGVEGIIEIKLTDKEREMLAASAEAVRDEIKKVKL
ncbi:MAG: malate dehydrogenase [Deltaproteobacteria bacterium]|uniref:Malate dehydrogenase n=1 Tax=Candidatus Zymogenus saltonus TaxID=2844893 RepID=A0A9D8PRF7_9DELT|nr:malate dehydrogenase [Candidatus Zymogenus saltonus]